jgi:hypothetical protein
MNTLCVAEVKPALPAWKHYEATEKPKRSLRHEHKHAITPLQSRSEASIASMKTLQCHCEARAKPSLTA